MQHVEEVLAMKDVDGVLISTPEHSHSPILKMAAEAGKDASVRIPLPMIRRRIDRKPSPTPGRSATR